jgi:ABC transporter substrate binding protein
MTVTIGRRELLAALGSAAAAWPLAAGAQQRERMRRIGVLMNLGSEGAEGQARNAAFLQGLQELGWTVGSNVRIEYRWGAGDAELFRRHASELVALAPDVILAGGGAVVPSLLQATRTVPIVFTGTPDPVGAGFVESLARPGGNATGFTIFEYGTSGKWLELLKEIAQRGHNALDLACIAYAEGAQLHPQRRRHGLDGAPLAKPGGYGGIANDRRSRHVTQSTPTGKQPATSIASSRARSRPICRYRRRRNMNW